jgi:hypothetical protein
MGSKVICEHCQKEFSKYGIKNHIAVVHLGDKKRVQGNKGKHQVSWNKGLNENIDERIKRGNDTLRKNYLEGKIIPSWKEKKHTEEQKRKISVSRKINCENIEERKRLRDIGRKGGFGKKGFTNNGTYYASNLEKKCFEFLEENNIIFEAHKEIPNSSKVSDIYLVKKDLWIELDGIDRERRKKSLGKSYEYWLEKLRLYEDTHLKYKICYNLEEFKKIIETLIGL